MNLKWERTMKNLDKKYGVQTVPKLVDMEKFAIIMKNNAPRIDMI